MAAGRLVVAMYCKHSWWAANCYVCSSRRGQWATRCRMVWMACRLHPAIVRPTSSVTLLARFTSFIMALLVSAWPVGRSLAISAHFPGWQMMLPGGWAGWGPSLASMLIRALCFWQSCSTSVVLGFFSSGKDTAHIIHVFVFYCVTGTSVAVLVTSWICASLLKMAACSCRQIILISRVCVFSSLDLWWISGQVGSFYRSSYDHNRYKYSNSITS